MYLEDRTVRLQLWDTAGEVVGDTCILSNTYQLPSYSIIYRVKKIGRSKRRSHWLYSYAQPNTPATTIIPILSETCLRT